MKKLINAIYRLFDFSEPFYIIGENRKRDKIINKIAEIFEEEAYIDKYEYYEFPELQVDISSVYNIIRRLIYKGENITSILTSAERKYLHGILFNRILANAKEKQEKDFDRLYQEIVK